MKKIVIVLVCVLGITVAMFTQRQHLASHIFVQRFLSGFYYLIGDRAASAQWLRKVAEQGDFSTQVRLANGYLYGIGLPQSYDDAFRWFSHAADRGDKTALYSLWLAYDTDDGLAENLEEKFRWAMKAAELGHAGAQIDVGDMYFNGTGVEKE